MRSAAASDLALRQVNIMLTSNAMNSTMPTTLVTAYLISSVMNGLLGWWGISMTLPDPDSISLQHRNLAHNLLKNICTAVPPSANLAGSDRCLRQSVPLSAEMEVSHAEESGCAAVPGLYPVVSGQFDGQGRAIRGLIIAHARPDCALYPVCITLCNV